MYSAVFTPSAAKISLVKYLSINSEDSKIPALASEVRCQPAIALDGGADGMAIYRRIESEYREKLNEGGILLMEIGHDQAEEIRNLFGEHATVEIIKDLDGNNRVAVIVPKG